ncbi:hypothetical protein [Citrobacter freundii]|uniref:hypothetical protein n=1 Tax=Citrobacter freundii TaxID=546 RepID=UPI00292A8B63|nr:hypothetical protein [Citrobacter freundii]MDV1744524.1 hypothetical protein [Citrobacter freundii]MEB0442303.1 hypothetical protein [Citrobacter freundii]
MSSREKFEQAIKSRFGDSIDYRVCKNSDGEYMAWDMQVAWWAWQAAEADMAVQLANAESKCRELAAENEKRNTHSEALAVDNAALREVVERMVNQFAMSGISPEEKSINPAKSLMFDAKSALFMPATDAFLAEVRAQAIESLLTESFRADIAGALADFDGMDEQSLQTLIWSGQPPEPDGDVWCVEYMSRAAAVLRKVREFAARLRKGAAQ